MPDITPTIPDVAYLRAPLEGEPILDAPERPDGSVWPLAITHASMFVFADTYERLVDAVCGSVAVTEDDRALAMMKHASNLKTQVNAVTLYENREELTDNQIEIMVSDVPTGMWDANVPLIVSVVDYVPYTDTEFLGSSPADGSPPYTNIVVLEPVTAEEYLKSLALTGYLALHFNTVTSDTDQETV